MDDATLWIEAGIKVFSETGKIELNKICKERGKFKSSFYNIYPNLEDSKGLDRFEEDLLKQHEEMVIQFFHKWKKMVKVYNDFHKSIDECIPLILEYIDYHRCTAQIRKGSEYDPKMKKELKRLIPIYMEGINYFWIYYGFPENAIVNDQAMRLWLDLSLTFLDKDVFEKKGREIIYARLRLRGGEKSISRST